MPKVIEWYRKPEKWLKTEFSIRNRWRKQQKMIILETSKMIDWMKIRQKTNEKVMCLAHKVSWNLENGLLLCCRPIGYEYLSPGLKIADLLYQPLLESQGLFNFRLWSGIIVCCLDRIGLCQILLRCSSLTPWDAS